MDRPPEAAPDADDPLAVGTAPSGPGATGRLARRARSVATSRRSREIGLYLGGEVGSRALTFGVLIALANLVTPGEYGLAALYFSIANLAAIVIALGLPNSIIRFYFEPTPFRLVLGAIVVLILGAAVVGLGLLALASGPIAAFLGVPVPLLLASLAGGFGIAVRSAWSAALRAQRRPVLYATTLLTEPLLGIALTAAWLVLGGGIDHLRIAVSFAAAAGIIALGGVAAWTRDPGLGWDPGVARELLVFSFPLIFHAFAMYALGTFDQVVINQTLGAEATGRYAFAYRWGMAMTALTAAFSAMWGPRFQELVRTDPGRARLDGLATRGVGALWLAAVGLMLVLPLAARPFTPEAFAPALRLVPVVTYAYVWYALYTVVVGYAIWARRTPRIALTSLGVVAATITVNYVVIPRLGYQVAALTSVGAYVSLFLAQWWLVRDIATDIDYRRLALGAVALGVVPAVLWMLV